MKIDTISAMELDIYATREDVKIVDVRNPEEFRKKHICGAINVQLSQIDQFRGDRGELIVLYCERGATSLIAASRLQKMGYNVKSVVGGINSYRGRLLCRD